MVFRGTGRRVQGYRMPCSGVQDAVFRGKKFLDPWNIHFYCVKWCSEVRDAVFRGKKFLDPWNIHLSCVKWCSEVRDAVFRGKKFLDPWNIHLSCVKWCSGVQDAVFRGKKFSLLKHTLCEMVFRGTNTSENKLSSVSRSTRTAPQLTLTVSPIVVFYTFQTTLIHNPMIVEQTYAPYNCKLA